ncbi:MAG: single-stranded-DNA-specific exonuclease RecJ [Armatimonadota bacterium]|nr:single-stranded-DNA-specific exonuclease RecJ [Armatimonadota bacterium]MDR7403873.1 single-stranded-DNA-specific exonuclease RecJ [Armatimonadota bacterium]
MSSLIPPGTVLRDGPPARWVVLPPAPQADDLARALGLHPVAARILCARGQAAPAQARQFLDCPLDNLEDPERIVDIPRAADRLAAAVRRGEPIAVYGDYDADGVCGTAILLRGLAQVGAAVRFLIPHRLRDGYGVRDALLLALADDGHRLVVTVDCGVTAVDEVARAVSRGQEVIVVDHHQPEHRLPAAAAVVDPWRADAPGSFREYAAAGLAFQLLRAVRRRLGVPDLPADVLDLAAVGTIADVVPLRGPNRILARWGLHRLSTGPCAGLAALAAAAGLTGEITARHVGFILAPRLNAAGRLADAAAAVRLLTTEDPAEAGALAGQLDALDQQRRALCDQILAQALQQVAAGGLERAPAVVVAGEGWHPGVLGIVAGQLCERYYRPAVVLTIQEGRARGSARSIPALHLVQALADCADVLERYGGHAQAAGVEVRADRIEEFARRFTGAVAARLRPDDLVPTLTIDAEIRLSDLTLELAEQLRRMEPFGAGNPEPILACRGLVALATRAVGDGQHLRLGVTDGLSYAEAVGFHMGDASEVLAFTRATVDLAGALAVDPWTDPPRPHLVVRDLVAPGLDLDEVLSDGRLLLERLFARAADYLADDARAVEQAEAFFTKVVGVTFEGRQQVVAGLRPGDALRLRREPRNPHDPHAVQVLTASGVPVGYLSARLAGRIAPSLDAGVRYAVTVAQVTGGGDRPHGLNISVHRQDDAGDLGPRRVACAGDPPHALVDRLRPHLLGDRPLRDVQRRVVDLLLSGRPVAGVVGPAAERRAVMGVAGACWAAAGCGLAVLAVPLASQVDRWYERLAPRLRRLGISCARAHGALGWRARQRLAGVAREGPAVVLCSLEYLRATLAGEAEVELRPSLLVVDCEPTIDGTTLDLEAAGVPAAVLGGRADAVRRWMRAAEVVRDEAVRPQLGLVDRRGIAAAEREEMIARIAGRGEKTVVYVGTRPQAVELARRLREAAGGQVAYYHDGLPLRVREVIEQLLADGKIRTLVAADLPGAVPVDLRQMVVAGIPAHRADLVDLIAAAGRDGRQAAVTLACRREDVGDLRAAVSARHPARDVLAALYRAVRARAERAGEMSWPDEGLAADLRQAGIGSRTASVGLEILAEAGVLTREYDGERWRISLVPGGRRELATSLRYAEGRREEAAAADVARWAFGPLVDILTEAAGPADGGIPR